MKKKIIQIALYVEFPDDEEYYDRLDFIQQDLMGEISCCVNLYELIRIEEFKV